jgi:hypothetical protein
LPMSPCAPDRLDSGQGWRLAVVKVNPLTFATRSRIDQAPDQGGMHGPDCPTEKWTLVATSTKTRKPMLSYAECSDLQRCEFSGTTSTSMERGRLARLRSTWAGSAPEPPSGARRLKMTQRLAVYRLTNPTLPTFYTTEPTESMYPAEFPAVSCKDYWGGNGARGLSQSPMHPHFYAVACSQRKRAAAQTPFR